MGSSSSPSGQSRTGLDTVETDHSFCRNIAVKSQGLFIGGLYDENRRTDSVYRSKRSQKSRCDDLSWLLNFPDRAPDRNNLFRFYFVWNGAWRSCINGCFSITRLKIRASTSTPWTIFRQHRPQRDLGPTGDPFS